MGLPVSAAEELLNLCSDSKFQRVAQHHHVEGVLTVFENFFGPRLAKWIALLTCLFLVNSECRAWAVRGSPATSITVNDLTAGAGSDLSAAKLDPSMVHLIDVSPSSGYQSTTWEVDISLNTQGASWPSNLAVYVRRTNTGSPANSTISGGSGYTLLTTSNQALFTGKGTATGVTIQYIIFNTSLANCPPGNYTLPITYTAGFA